MVQKRLVIKIIINVAKQSGGWMGGGMEMDGWGMDGGMDVCKSCLRIAYSNQK